MEFLKATAELDFNFYRIPKNFKDLIRRGMNHTAILLYGLLLDRWELSRKNKWSNEKGEVFLFFGRDEAAEELCVSKPTIIKAFKELAEHGLIFEKRQGQNKPNKIYLAKTPIIQRKENKLTSETTGDKPEQPQNLPEIGYHNSEGKDSLPPNSQNPLLPEVNKFDPNDTEYSNTDLNYTEIRVGTVEPTRPLPSLSYELSLEAWEYFKSEYRSNSKCRTGKAEKHPPYRPDRLEDYLLTLSAFIEDNGLHYDELQGMIQLYFNTQFQKDCNYRFAHFCTEGILENRVFEHRREPDHY